MTVNDSDRKYIARLAARMSMVPIRLFIGNKCVVTTDEWHFPVDPASAILPEIQKSKDDVGCLETRSFALYGFARSGKNLLVAGPFFTQPPNPVDTERLGISLGVTPHQIGQFVSAFQSLGVMPRETILLMICALGFAMTGRHLNVEHIIVHASQQKEFTRQMAEQELAHTSYQPDKRTHSSGRIEKMLEMLIQKGEPERLRIYLGSLPTFRAGILSPSRLRQEKNLFITEATLTSRAAIRGGMDEDGALTLSDQYINKCENMNNPNDISNLSWHMALDYAERVRRVRIGDNPSPLVLEVGNFIQSHIFRPLGTSDIAHGLGVSRGFLSTQFKKQAGITLSEYIRRRKIEESKTLMRDTDQSVAAISTYLGFSSQSNFTAVFRRHVGLTPARWRRQYKVS